MDIWGGGGGGAYRADPVAGSFKKGFKEMGNGNRRGFLDGLG